MTVLNSIRLGMVALAMTAAAGAFGATDTESSTTNPLVATQGGEPVVSEHSPFAQAFVKTEEAVEVAACWWYNGKMYCG